MDVAVQVDVEAAAVHTSPSMGVAFLHCRDGGAARPAKRAKPDRARQLHAIMSRQPAAAAAGQADVRRCMAVGTCAHWGAL